MNRTVAVTVLVAFGLSLAGSGLRAHHSGSEYDRRTIEIEGRLVEVAWQNPHVHFLVRTTDPTGKVVNVIPPTKGTPVTAIKMRVGNPGFPGEENATPVP